LTKTLDDLGFNPAPPNWLSRTEACDIYFSGQDSNKAFNAISSILAGVKIDFYIQESNLRRKKILVADMDSTIVASETIDELANLAGCGAEIASITKRSMKGELDFNESIHERVALLAGLEVSSFSKILAGIKLNPGAETLVCTMAADGAFTVLVSGGFENFSGPVARMAGFSQHHANRFEIDNGHLTGRVIEPILGPDAKLETLLTLSSKCGVDISGTLAIGDGANDIPMIQAAGLGIAYHGKPVTRDAVLANPKAKFLGACIDHADLTAALFFQGYPRRKFTKHRL
jgi:phosphoserine phosphatase